jgi:hypothetical protein
LLLQLVAKDAGAAAGEGRVAVLPFAGPGADLVEERLVAAIPRDYEVIPVEQVDAAIERAGDKMPAGPAEFVALARRLDAAVLIEGRTTQEGGWRLRVTARRGGNGLAGAGVEFRGRTRADLAANVRQQGPDTLLALLDRATGVGLATPEAPPRSSESRVNRAPAADAAATGRTKAARSERRANADGDAQLESDGEETPPRLTADKRRNGSDATAPTWEISVGPRVISRAFVYTDNVSGMPGYSLPGTVGVSGEAAFYPAAGSRSGASHFGFDAEWDSSVGAKTQGRDAQKSYATKAVSYRVGPRYRDRSGPFTWTLGADYGDHQFSAEIAGTLPPNVHYTFVRPNFTARMAVAGGVSIGLSAAYLDILSVGGLGDPDRFPRITSVGAEVGAMLGYALDEDFDVRLTADLRHYAHNMHVKPGDGPYIVGGAVDEHFGGAVQITYRIR